LAKTKHNDCYVYAWYDEDEVRYIGKGRGGRAYRHPFLNVQIVASNLTSDEACNFEKLLIAAIGRADLGQGPLVNTTNGGDGGDTLSGRKMYHDPLRPNIAGKFFIPGNEPEGWLLGRHPKAYARYKRTPEVSERSARTQRGVPRPQTTVSARNAWKTRRKEDTHKKVGCLRCRRLVSVQNFEKHYGGNKCLNQEHISM